MKKKIQSGKADVVFVLRFGRETGWGTRPTAWHAEIKELGPTRDLDQRFWAEGPAATLKLIVKRLQRSLKREA